MMLNSSHTITSTSPREDYDPKRTRLHNFWKSARCGVVKQLLLVGAAFVMGLSCALFFSRLSAEGASNVDLSPTTVQNILHALQPESHALSTTTPLSASATAVVSESDASSSIFTYKGASKPCTKDFATALSLYGPYVDQAEFEANQNGGWSACAQLDCANHPSQCRRALWDMIIFFRDLFARYDVEFFFEGSMLLFAARQGGHGYLPETYMDDADVVISTNAMRFLMDPNSPAYHAIRAAGYHIFIDSEDRDGRACLLQNATHPGKLGAMGATVSIDFPLLGVELRSKALQFSGFSCKFDLCDEDLYPLEPLTLNGERFYGPHRYTEFLAFAYGENWRTPNDEGTEAHYPCDELGFTDQMPKKVLDRERSARINDRLHYALKL